MVPMSFRLQFLEDTREEEKNTNVEKLVENDRKTWSCSSVTQCTAMHHRKERQREGKNNNMKKISKYKPICI